MSPTAEPYKSDFPISAWVEDDCVEPGGSMTIVVDAREKSGVGYLAVYAGEESGAPEPFGDGHGGNAGDISDESGHYEDTWVVSPDAPVGPARVEVVVGRNGGFSEMAVPFRVAGPGGCDA